MFDWDTSIKRLGYLNQLAEDPALWNDAQEAQKLMRERQQLEDGINSIRTLSQSLEDNIELIAMGDEEGDKSIVT
ncbi:PCRF domain-containing protein, partial [Mycobacterium tuberculosis]|nr:PCRF domain-containing protein [Mycobacterium tuberculosis]